MRISKKDLPAMKMLTDRSCFLDIQSKGKKWVSHGLVVQIKENNLGYRRVGFTVSKKVDKSAVKRNRIKRRLRAVSSDVLPLCSKDSCDYILVGRRGGSERSYDLMINDLKWCLKKTGYYHKTEHDNK